MIAAAVAVGALAAVIAVLLVLLARAEARADRFADRAAQLLDRIDVLRDRHAAERTEWAAAHHAERKELRDQAYEERQILVAELAAARTGGGGIGPTLPWPQGEPEVIIGADEATERQRLAEAREALEAELAARQGQATGVGL